MTSASKSAHTPAATTAVALTRSELNDPAVLSVSEKDKPLLAEALRRGESTREGMEAVLKEYGTWMFVNLFAADSNAAINDRKTHPVWQNLLARSGGSTLRINERMLTVCLLSAAYDQRLNMDAWRLLDLGRKDLLLRLADDDLLRKGAAHVMSARLTWRMTREYVQNVLAESGAPIEVRVSVSQVKTWLKTIEARLSTAGFQKKLASAALQMEQKERQLLRRQVESVQRELEELASKLAPKKGG